MFYFPNTRKPDFCNIKKIDYDRYWLERGFEINKKLKAREQVIFNEIKKGSKALDVGCGNSYLPVALQKDKECQVTVADVSKTVLAGFEKYNISAVYLNLEEDNWNLDQKYEYIVLSEVLEHLKNPEEVIRKLKNYADYFLISIPNSVFI